MWKYRENELASDSRTIATLFRFAHFVVLVLSVAIFAQCVGLWPGSIESDALLAQIAHLSTKREHRTANTPNQKSAEGGTTLGEDYFFDRSSNRRAPLAFHFEIDEVIDYHAIHRQEELFDAEREIAKRRRAASSMNRVVPSEEILSPSEKRLQINPLRLHQKGTDDNNNNNNNEKGAEPRDQSEEAAEGVCLIEKPCTAANENSNPAAVSVDFTGRVETRDFSRLAFDSNFRRYRDAAYATRSGISLYKTVLDKAASWRRSIIFEAPSSILTSSISSRKNAVSLIGEMLLNSGDDENWQSKNNFDHKKENVKGRLKARKETSPPLGALLQKIVDLRISKKLIGAASDNSLANQGSKGAVKANQTLQSLIESLKLLGESERRQRRSYNDNKKLQEGEGEEGSSTAVLDYTTFETLYEQCLTGNSHTHTNIDENRSLFSTNTASTRRLWWEKALVEGDVVLAAEESLGALPRVMLKGSLLIQTSVRVLDELTLAILKQCYRTREEDANTGKATRKINGNSEEDANVGKASEEGANSKTLYPANVAMTTGGEEKQRGVLEKLVNIKSTDSFGTSGGVQQQQQQERGNMRLVPQDVSRGPISRDEELSFSFPYSQKDDKRFHSKPFSHVATSGSNSASAVTELAHVLTQAAMKAEDAFANPSAVEFSSLLELPPIVGSDSNKKNGGDSPYGNAVSGPKYAQITELSAFMKNAADKIRYQLSNWEPMRGVMIPLSSSTARESPAHVENRWSPLPFNLPFVLSRNTNSNATSLRVSELECVAPQQEPLIIIGLCTVSRQRAKYLANTLKSLIDGVDRLSVESERGGVGKGKSEETTRNQKEEKDSRWLCKDAHRYLLNGNVRFVVFNAQTPPEANSEVRALSDGVEGRPSTYKNDMDRGFVRFVDRSRNFIGPRPLDDALMKKIIDSNVAAFLRARRGREALLINSDTSKKDGHDFHFANLVREAFNPLSRRFYPPTPAIPFKQSKRLPNQHLLSRQQQHHHHRNDGQHQWRTIDDEYNAKYNWLATQPKMPPIVARRWGDDEKRLRWRAKQALDAAFLFDYVGAAHRHFYRPDASYSGSSDEKSSSSSSVSPIFTNKHKASSFYESPEQAAAGSYFLMLEDDIDTTKGYITKLREWIAKLNRGEVEGARREEDKELKEGGSNDSSQSRLLPLPWTVASFYNPWEDVKDGQVLPPNKFFGMIGQLFRTSDLPVIAAFLRKNYDQSPLDWLMVDYLKKINGTMVVHTPSLFEHVGSQSSLEGKEQPARAADFRYD